MCGCRKLIFVKGTPSSVGIHTTHQEVGTDVAGCFANVFVVTRTILSLTVDTVLWEGVVAQGTKESVEVHLCRRKPLFDSVWCIVKFVNGEFVCAARARRLPADDRVDGTTGDRFTNELLGSPYVSTHLGREVELSPEGGTFH